MRVIDEENNHLEKEKRRNKGRRDSERETLSIKTGDMIVEKRLGRISDRKKQRKSDISYQQPPRCRLIKDARAVRG